MGRLTR
jgi:hypothetical protein